VAFQVYPSEREAKRLKKDRKPIHTKVVLVDLSTGHKTEFEKVRRFAFSGEECGPEAPAAATASQSWCFTSGIP